MSVNTVNERLARLTGLGTSVWLDQIGRSLIEDGTLARFVDQYSLRGMTSNPAIFEKAILESDDYDAIISEGFADGRTAVEIFHDIAVADVKAAAGVLTRCGRSASW